MSKNSIIPFLKDYLINFLTSPFLLDTNGRYMDIVIILANQEDTNDPKQDGYTSFYPPYRFFSFHLRLKILFAKIIVLSTRNNKQ